VTEHMKLTSAVIFVRDLDRSKEFYGQLLQLNVELTTGEALLLYAGEGDHVVLRELERSSGATGGVVGVQYLIWTARDPEDLDRCERVLQTWGVHVSTWFDDDIRVVEGRDPDRTPILVTYPAGPGKGWTRLPTRVFSY
jgi:catechol-2,3-dioxygenase